MVLSAEYFWGKREERDLSMEVESLKPLGVAGIVREAIKIPRKNGRIMFLVTFFTLLPFSLLVLYHNLAMLPYAKEVVSKASPVSTDDPNSAAAAADKAELLRAIGVFLRAEGLYASAMGIVSLIALMATVYTAAATHARKHLTLRALLWRVITTWKRPFITWLFIVLIVIASGVIFMLSIGVITIMLGEGVQSSTMCLVLFIMAAGLFIHYMAVWMLALVISIVEDNCYGLEALGKAEVLIKGRKVQGLVLVLATSLCGVLVSWLWNLDMWTNSGLSIGVEVALVCLVCFVKLWTLCVFTVFYAECKKSYGEKVEMEGLVAEEPKYAALPSSV